MSFLLGDGRFMEKSQGFYTSPIIPVFWGLAKKYELCRVLNYARNVLKTISPLFTNRKRNFITFFVPGIDKDLIFPGHQWQQGLTLYTTVGGIFLA